MDDTFEKQSAIAYFIIKECINRDDNSKVEYLVGANYINNFSQEESINAFISNVVRPLYEYINESLEENTIYSRLQSTFWLFDNIQNL